MFGFCFALFVLISLGVNVESNQLPSGKVDTAGLFGQLHHLLGNQPKVSCAGVRRNIKYPHPQDNTKYIVCRDEQRYNVFTCPNGGVFNDTQKACLDLCQQNNPCLNQGQCIILQDLSLQCVCKRDWTGERCETPLSSCAYNPCGPDAECRMLKADDYKQDYVCLCNNYKSYGQNCQQTVPNPCLLQAQQFHPFAYSRRAYINCDSELIFFQPCSANLYWNQEFKRCDRELPLLLRAPFTDLKWRTQQTNNGTAKVFRLTGFASSNLAETTTMPPRVFQLSGFSSNNQNNQVQTSENVQSWQEHNKRTWTPSSSFETTTIPSRVFQLSGFSSNNQNNQVQTPENVQSWQEHNKRTWTPSSSFETTTESNVNVPKGYTIRFLPGWQSNRQQN